MKKMNINTCNIKLYVFLLILCLNPFITKAQTYDKFSANIVWRGVEKTFVNDKAIEYVAFDNASHVLSFDGKNPSYLHTFPIYSNEVEVDYYVENITYERIPENELLLLQEITNEKPVFNHFIKSSRDNHSLCFEIDPFFIEENVAMRMVSCDVYYSLKSIRKDRNYNFAENSVLASGKWYMMSLASTGLYKITYSELSSMGVPVASINPKNIRLYHNGGGVLPAMNNEKRHDDLVEIPIYVSGESDGSFDSEDYIEDF